MGHLAEKELFYDPFAEQGQEYFDPEDAHQTMWEKYKAGDVEHDYTADKFVADTEALMLDAQFLGRFDQAQMIAARMHEICGEDHGLRQSVNARESLSGILDSYNGDKHDHSHSSQVGQKDENDKDPKKKKSKKRKYSGLLGLFLKN